MEGYETAIVSRLNDVLPMARQVRPSLILMDVHVGNSDTLGVLRELCADKTAERAPIMMASGMDRSTECLAAGADDFILKPFRPSELVERAAGLISKQDKNP